MEVKVNSNFKTALRDIGNVPRKYVQKAMVTALNKVGAEVFTQAKRELKDATGLKAGDGDRTRDIQLGKLTHDTTNIKFYNKLRCFLMLKKVHKWYTKPIIKEY